VRNLLAGLPDTVSNATERIKIPKGFKACGYRHLLIDNANMKASKASLALRYPQ
jgi:hypothetical protein